MVRVLMVCMGNICRSPMAEAVFQAKIDEAGLADEITVGSAGTSKWHAGEPAHVGTLAVLKDNGISYNGRSRPFIEQDFSDFDYVMAMDTENLGYIRRLQQVGGKREDGPEVRLFLDYAREAGRVKLAEVPDPYYDNNFPYVYQLVEAGADELLKHIREKHNL
jgi:protein-tyrosine phosphatase